MAGARKRYWERFQKKMSTISLQSSQIDRLPAMGQQEKKKKNELQSRKPK